MNCDYTLNGAEPVIHSFGRTPRNIYERLHIEVHGFEPFLYIDRGINVASEKIKRAIVDPRFQTSITNKPVTKIVTYVPSEVSDLRDREFGRLQTYQSKVLFPINFMCMTGIKSGFSSHISNLYLPSNESIYSPDYIVLDYNKIIPNNDVYVDPLFLTFDIETNNSESNPVMGEWGQEMTASTFKDNYSKNEYTFVWHPDSPNRTVKKLVHHYSYSNIDMNWKIMIFDNEMEMFYNIRDFLMKVSPDIYTGWNVNFDMLYMMGRMGKLGIDYSFLSPVGEAKIVPISENNVVKRYQPVIKGVSVLDALGCYKGITRFDGMKDSYALDDVGRDELSIKKLHFEGRVGKLWMNDFNKFIRYNARDVEICHEVIRKLNIMTYHDTVRRQTGCRFEDTVFTSRIIETEVLRKSISIGKVIPTKRPVPHGGKKKKKFKGAIVLDPVVGKHFNVLMLDLKSLYPSIIMTINISPETRIDNVNDYAEEQLKQFIRSARGIYYRKDITGFAKECLVGMNNHRDVYKGCVLAIADLIDQESVVFKDGDENAKRDIIDIISKNKYKLNNEVIEIVSSNIKSINFSGKNKESVMQILKSEETKYDLMQKAEKAKINTWYGVMGKEDSSLSSVEDAESVTLSGRAIILFSADVASSDGMSEALKKNFGIETRLKVLYGDTDSLYLSGLEMITDFTLMTKIAEFVGKYMTGAYGEFCKRVFNADVHYLKIRCEEIAKVFCMSPKKESDEGGKKRYWFLPWGVLKGDKGWIEYHGKDIDVKGFETRRSNVSKIGRYVQRKVMEFIVFNKNRSYIRGYLDEINDKLNSGKYPIDSITFNTSIKEWEYYDDVKKGRPETSWDEHVRAAWWGNTYLGHNWKPGDKVKVIYVKKSPAGLRPMDVLAVEGDKIPNGFEIDYEKVFEKQIKDKLVSVLATEGWTFNSVMSAMQIGNL